MLKHYLEKISELEFLERNEEVPRLVTAEKGSLNARGMLNSTLTLQALSEFFAAEFTARCDFLKTFVISYSNLLLQSNDSDVITEAKTLFQEASFIERDKIMSLYASSIKEIASGLQNESMKHQIKSSFEKKMEARIKKNNLYIEVAYSEILAATSKEKSIFILQPNFNGIGIDLIELWNRYFKKT